MDYMRTMPDNYVDLAIVDPPYSDETDALDRLLQDMKGRKARAGANRTIRGKAPDKLYWNELFRVSKNQIIWGVNWCEKIFGIGRIVWDKLNEGSNFSDCELAYQSLSRKTDKFTFRWNGMLQGNMKNKEMRIHPNQKPVALYLWLLQNYAKQGDKILDTHAGSLSSGIACEIEGFEYVALEKDPDYFRDASKRLKQARITTIDMFKETKPKIAIQESMELEN